MEVMAVATHDNVDQFTCINIKAVPGSPAQLHTDVGLPKVPIPVHCWHGDI